MPGRAEEAWLFHRPGNSGVTAWPSPRVTVFVSSTIGECASERLAARKAIEAIKCDPVLFETTGARPHPARITYLAGLSRSQICVIIWKESYGYIDPAIKISGIEDEFRVARDRAMDILLYIKSDAPNRDARLTALIDEARAFVTTHSYQTESDLQDQISSDITSVLGAAYFDRVTPRAERLVDPSAVLAGTLPPSTVAIARPALEQQIDDLVAQKPVTWLVGAPGSGKTVLLAQWSIRRQTAYVNARGLSLRHLLQTIVSTLSGSSVAIEGITIEDARQALQAAWHKGARWPLVIDDPEDIPELVRAISDLGSADGSARVIIGARTVVEPRSPLVGNPSLTNPRG
jgi:hypothetical protein